MSRFQYTLQECFEKTGEKFPFTVHWYNYGITKQLTFYSKITIGARVYWIYNKDINAGLDEVIIKQDENSHWYFAKIEDYDYKLQEYNNDFEKLIGE